MPANFAPKQIREELTLARGMDTASGTNADAVITYPALPVLDEDAPAIAHAITEGVWYSYSGSGTLSGGRLTIADGADVVADVDITAKGQGHFPYRKHITPGNALVVTLYDGGVDVTGKVTVLGSTRVMVAPAEE